MEFLKRYFYYFEATLNNVARHKFILLNNKISRVELQLFTVFQVKDLFFHFTFIGLIIYEIWKRNFHLNFY